MKSKFCTCFNSLNFITISIVVLLSFSTSKLYAQDCNEKILEAETLYEVGQFNEVLTMLKYCADSASDENNERWKSLRLIALAHLANKDNELARGVAIKLMEIDPTYKPSSLKDPSEFVKLLSGITVIPKLSIGLGFAAGTNITLPSVSNAFMVSDQSKTFKGLSAVQVGLSSLYQINSSLSVQTSLVITRKKFELDHSFGNWSLQMNERLTYLTIPVRGRYTFMPQRRLRPFVQVGGYGGVLMFSDNNFYAEHIPSNESYSLENVSSKGRRATFDFGLTVGAGASFALKTGQAFIQANYFRSSQNITNEDERYKYSDLFYSYFYLDDDITLHNYSVSVGYSHYLNYKVVK